MDKSVAQKFMIVMSVFIAMFATVFVCGSIVNSSVSTDSYLQPVPKVNYRTVSYTDTIIEQSPDYVVSDSDTLDYDGFATTAHQNITVVENGVTVVEFIDSEEDDYTSETIAMSEEEIDEQFLYMTTTTTQLPHTYGEAFTTTTTQKTTKKTTKRTTSVTAAKPLTTRTTAVKTSTTTKKTTTKKTTVSSVTEKTTSTTKKTTTEKITQTTSTTISTFLPVLYARFP